VARGLGVPVVTIAGNHDSPDRLEFASALLADGGLHLAGTVGNPPRAVTLADEHGPVRFHLLPYAEPALVRQCFEGCGAHSHDAALRTLVEATAKARAGVRRSVAVAHCFVTGGEGSESERPLTVGGAENVDAAHFAPFAYTALGHLHAPQRIADRIEYAGSLLKYSFSEVNRDKSVTLVEIDASGACATERIRLTPRRDLRIIDGELQALLDNPAPGLSRDDYLLVRLRDTRALLDPMGKLRDVYPNVLHLERPGLLHRGEVQRPGKEQLGRSEQALFESFFSQITGEALSDSEREAFARVVDELRAKQREAQA
jgi:exonuclease SbcD